MTQPAVTIREDASVAEAARLMQSRQVKRLPVQHRGGRPEPGRHRPVPGKRRGHPGPAQLPLPELGLER